MRRYYRLTRMSHFDDSKKSTPRVTQVGEGVLLFHFTPSDSVVLELSIQQKIWQLVSWLEPLRGALSLVEIVPGMGNLLLKVSREMHLDELSPIVLGHWATLSEAMKDGRHIEIPVTYGGTDGPDLEAVANQCGLAPDELIARHCAAVYHVYCLGFQPGFAYLGGLDPSLHVPRLANPRVQVPIGSVAIGGAQTAVYSTPSPGGWHIIGHTEVRMFDPYAEQAVLLRPGDTVRFVNTAESL